MSSSGILTCCCQVYSVRFPNQCLSLLLMIIQNSVGIFLSLSSLSEILKTSTGSVLLASQRRPFSSFGLPASLTIPVSFPCPSLSLCIPAGPPGFSTYLYSPASAHCHQGSWQLLPLRLFPVSILETPFDMSICCIMLVWDTIDQNPNYYHDHKTFFFPQSIFTL